MTSKYESDNNRDMNGLEAKRYAAVSDGADGLVVYDTENETAWVKSDGAVELDEMA